MRLLDGPDLFHLAQERPARPAHTLKAAVLEHPISCAAVDKWARETLATIEPLRLHLARVPLAWPVWADGGQLDLDHHVQHRAVASPGGDKEFADAMAELCSGRLDRARPLWRLWHLTGLAGNRDALVFQIHHAVGDGQASVALWRALADGAHPGEPSLTSPSTRELAATAVRQGARQMVRLPSQMRRFAGYVRRSRAVDREGEQGVTKAFTGPPTRFNRDPEDTRRCAFVDLRLARLQSVRAATGATVNEVFLTVCGGAVRRHLEELGEPPDAALTATVPAALPDRAHTYGNSVTTLYVSLHSELTDPVGRLEAVRASFAATRRATERDWRLLPDWQRYPRLNGSLIRLMELTERRGACPAYNLIVSTVRGPEPLSLAGVPVEELRSIGPLSARLGLNITAWSYGDAFMVGIHTFASAGDGLDRLTALLADELAQLEACVHDPGGIVPQSTAVRSGSGS